MKKLFLNTSYSKVSSAIGLSNNDFDESNPLSIKTNKANKLHNKNDTGSYVIKYSPNPKNDIERIINLGNVITNNGTVISMETEAITNI